MRTIEAVAIALVAGMLLAGAPAAYVFEQQSATQAQTYRIVTSQADSWRLRAAAENATIMGLERYISALISFQENLQARLAAAPSADEVNALQAQIASDGAAIAGLNQQVADLASLAGLNHVETLGAWPISSSGLCFARFYGPLTVYNYGGYLRLAFIGTGSATETVTWSGYGIDFSATATGNASFPVLPTTEIKIAVQECGTADLTMTAYLAT